MTSQEPRGGVPLQHACPLPCPSPAMPVPCWACLWVKVQSPGLCPRPSDCGVGRAQLNFL